MNPKVEQFLISALHRLTPNGCPIPHKRWQKLLSKTLRAIVPSPLQSPFMEWEHGTWIGSFTGYDEVGRQLGEANVLPEWMATPLDDKWQSFKGPGIRQGHPYNVDAMHEMLHCWNDLVLDAATLRDMYCRQYHRQGRLSAMDLYIITMVGISIPSFMLRRGDAPTPDGHIPRRAAAAFKVVGGMYAATNRMLGQGHAMLMQDELDVDAFLQYLEDERLLLSPESRACAAPVKMIRQIVSAAIDPSSQPVQDGLPHLGADAERAFAYGCLCARIDVGVLLYWRSLRHYLKPLLSHAETPAAVREALLEEPELGMEDNTPLSVYGDIAQQLFALFGPSAAEQQFLACLPLADAEDHNLDIAAIAAHCFKLELAMHDFFYQQQASLDQLLQRPALPWSGQTWSPAPGSRFLQALADIDPRLAAT